MKTPHEPTRPASTLEVRHLRLIRAIAAEGSVTRAAGRLFLTQSALSHQLLDLERSLATRLFDRVGKRMVPTGAGSKLLVASERMLGELEILERDLRGTQSDSTTPLRVTTSCYTSYHWLPAALTSFEASHPRVEITIVLEATRRAQEALLNDEVDVAILTEPPKDEAWLVVPIVSSDFVALASPRHPALATRKRKEALRWGELRGSTVLVHDISEKLTLRLEAAVRDSYEQAHGERVANPVNIRRVPLTEAIVELARAGGSVAIADRWIVAPYANKQLLCLPLVPRGRRTFFAVWRRSNPRDLPIRELVRLIEGAVGFVDGPR